MKKNRTELFCWATASLSLVIALCCLPTLPDRVPMHWNVAGEVDGWGGRISALYIPLMSLGLNLLFVLLPRIDPRRGNYRRFGGAYDAFRLGFNLFLLGISIIVLVSAYRPGSLPVGKLVPAAVGALFCLIGNYMPKFKPNYFLGIRTPWTLASEPVWRRTHRLGGALWFWSGLAALAGSLLLPQEATAVLLTVLLVVLVGVPLVASYLFYRQEEREGRA